MDKKMNNILIQKNNDKKDILFLYNYRILVDKLKDLYNIKNRGEDVFDQYLEIGSIQRVIAVLIYINKVKQISKILNYMFGCAFPYLLYILKHTF